MQIYHLEVVRLDSGTLVHNGVEIGYTDNDTQYYTKHTNDGDIHIIKKTIIIKKI